MAILQAHLLVPSGDPSMEKALATNYAPMLLRFSGQLLVAAHCFSCESLLA